jgi:hypothetical protein
MSPEQSSVEVNAEDKAISAAESRTRIPALPDYFIVVLALVCAGFAYRAFSSRLNALVGSPVALPISVKLMPKNLAGWRGSDLAIPTTTKKYMERNFADDFISRRYIKGANEAWADLYVVYCSSRPGGILGHRPRVCYPGHGWIHESTTESQFVSARGQEIPCLIHEFHKPAPALDRTVVLNFYVLNGRITTKEDDFSGAGWRRPNMAGDPAKYVAQIQVSSPTENGVRLLARDAADYVLDFLPDPNGNVAVTDAALLTGDL